MADLVAAVEHAEQYGNANPYWGWSSEVRREYREFHAAKNAKSDTVKQRTPVPEPTEEGESTVQSDEEVGTELAAEDEHGEDDAVEVRTEVEPAAAAQPKRQRSAKQQRYQDYLSIARDELKREDPSRKTIPHGECHAKCKELLTEDGWI